jgi:CheY-like chemotaxis protein
VPIIAIESVVFTNCFPPKRRAATPKIAVGSKTCKLSAGIPEMPKLLIAEDEPMALAALVDLFACRGWKVVAARDGDEALRLIDPSFDAVFLDWMMPRKNGFQALAGIRARRELINIAVVMVTSTANPERIVESMKAGADDWVCKPIDWRELETKVLAAVAERRARVGGDQRLLRVFLCHASEDKPTVRDLHERLKQDGFLPWLDEAQLCGGQDWELEIRRAVRDSDVVVACISRKAVGKTGFLQKEIREVLDRADEHPEGTVFVIPVKLEGCDMPDRLRRWQWIDLTQQSGYGKLVEALRRKAETL